jgi:hypothetical protein
MATLQAGRGSDVAIHSKHETTAKEPPHIRERTGAGDMERR